MMLPVAAAAIGFSLLYLLVSAITKKRVRAGALRGKRVLITGASTGIGEALAWTYFRCGANLILTARRRPLLEKLRARLLEEQKQKQQQQQEIHIITADLTVHEDRMHLIKETLAICKQGIDHIVLNAGMGSNNESLQQQSPDLHFYRKVMEINYWANVVLLRGFTPALEKSSGTFVVIASVAGLFGVPARTGYAPTKHAIIALCDSLRFEISSAVTICCVCPGFVVSHIHDNVLSQGFERDMRHFMSTEECAKRTVEAALNKVRLAILPAKIRFGYLVNRCFPHWFMDHLIRNGAKPFRPINANKKMQ